MNMKKKFLYLALILAVAVVAVPTGLSYAQSMTDQKLESINQLFAQKGESLNTGQFRKIP